MPGPGLVHERPVPRREAGATPLIRVARRLAMGLTIKEILMHDHDSGTAPGGVRSKRRGADSAPRLRLFIPGRKETLLALMATSSVLFLAACATPPDLPPGPERRPAGPEAGVSFTAPPLDDEAAGTAFPVLPAPAGKLTLRTALAQALAGNPDLAAFSYESRAAEARTIQAGVPPAPALGLDSQDFGGKGERRGFESAQTSLSLSQTVELGEKRAKRVRAARLDESLAAWDYEAKRLDTLLETTRAFVGLLASQRRLSLARESLALDRKTADTVRERVRAGRVSPLEEKRAGVAVATATLFLERSRRDLQSARQRLAALWGASAAQFDEAIGDLDALVSPPSLDRLMELAVENPDLARWTTEIESRTARLSVERSKEIPDPTFSAGVRRYGNDGSTAFLAGVSLPIPVAGINQGNVLEAQQRLAKGYAERRAAEARVAVEVRQGFERLASAYDEVMALRRDILPAATAAFDGAAEGYRQGKFPLIDVLDAERSLSDANGRLIDAEAGFQVARAELERLIGQPLPTPRQPAPQRPGE